MDGPSSPLLLAAPLGSRGHWATEGRQKAIQGEGLRGGSHHGPIQSLIKGEEVTQKLLCNKRK